MPKGGKNTEELRRFYKDPNSMRARTQLAKLLRNAEFIK